MGYVHRWLYRSLILRWLRFIIPHADTFSCIGAGLYCFLQYIHYFIFNSYYIFPSSPYLRTTPLPSIPLLKTCCSNSSFPPSPQSPRLIPSKSPNPHLTLPNSSPHSLFPSKSPNQTTTEYHDSPPIHPITTPLITLSLPKPAAQREAEGGAACQPNDLHFKAAPSPPLPSDWLFLDSSRVTV